MAPSGPLRRDVPFFQISAEERTRLIRGLLEIRWGDSREVVIAILGEPSESAVVCRKEDGSFLFRDLRYYVRRWQKDFVNVKRDLYVQLSFDEHDRLIGVLGKLGEFAGELRGRAVLNCPPKDANPVHRNK